MTNQVPKCFIRDLDRVKPDSGYMDISFILEQVRKGLYGHNLELIESYIIDDEIPQVLRVVARFTTSQGFILVKHDDEFETFINSLDMDIPQSPCLEYLQKQNIKFHIN